MNDSTVKLFNNRRLTLNAVNKQVQKIFAEAKAEALRWLPAWESRKLALAYA